MQRIIIRERDLTSNVEGLSSYDVAYVPGFRAISGDTNDKYYRKPTLFTNRYAFQSAIGHGSQGNSALPRFSDIETYPKFSDGEGFPDRAIPTSEVMFNANEIDLGYRTALYLLSLGIPVYYEVMNNSTGTFSDSWTYTKVVDGVFNPGLTYYTGTSTTTTQTQSDNLAGKVTYTQATFLEAVSNVSGVYTFEGTGVEEGSSVSIVWLLNGTNVTSALGSYGIVLGEVTPVANEQYTITVVVSDPDVSDPESVPPEESTNFTAATGIQGFVPGVDYFTVSKEEIRPISVKSMYDGLKARFIDEPSVKDSSFDSMGDYSVKYITSGGYPTFEYAIGDVNTYPLMTGMIDMAAARQDAVALIDHTNNPERDLYPSTLGGSGNAVIDIMRTVCANIDNATYGAMFTPWYNCSHGAIADSEGYSQSAVPGSVAYLSALAAQIRDYNPWLAVSGVTRGRVPNLTTSDELHTVQLLTNNIADAYQTLPSDAEIAQISINPITYIRNVGYCIWGNRTLRNNGSATSALSFLNIRGVVSDIKKVIYEASQNNLFEQNTDITWINFKSVIIPLLDRMVANYILQDYSLTRYTVDPETGAPVPAYKVLAVIKIQPINSIEVFDLTVQLENADVFVIEASN